MKSTISYFGKLHAEWLSPRIACQVQGISAA